MNFFCIIFCMVKPGQFIYIMLHMIILEQFQTISKTTTSFSFSSLTTSFFFSNNYLFPVNFANNYLSHSFFPPTQIWKSKSIMCLFVSMIFILIQIKFDDDINNDELLETGKGKNMWWVCTRKSISPAVLSTWPLRKYFSHPSLVIYFFRNPINQTETRTANRWGTTNSKPPGPIIIMMSQWEKLSSSQIIFITLFSAGAQPCYALLSHSKQIGQSCWAKTIFLSQTSILIQLYYAGSHSEHRWRCSKGKVLDPFSPGSKLGNYAQPKPFSWAKPAFWFNCTVQDHILSTAGDALRVRSWTHSVKKYQSESDWLTNWTSTHHPLDGCLLWLGCGWTSAELMFG
jgi:hypothetical protein